jgi:hypothetical protein
MVPKEKPCPARGVAAIVGTTAVSSLSFLYISSLFIAPELTGQFVFQELADEDVLESSSSPSLSDIA